MRVLDYLLLLQLALNSQSLLAHGFRTTIQVCQNKDCCQRFEGQSMDLVRTLYDLLPPSSQADIDIEATGCLSQCGKGPNMSVKRPNEKELLVHGVRDATMAATELELSCSLTTHPTLLAAVKVLEKAEKGKISLLDSSIRLLE